MHIRVTGRTASALLLPDMGGLGWSLSICNPHVFSGDAAAAAAGNQALDVHCRSYDFSAFAKITHNTIVSLSKKRCLSTDIKSIQANKA